MELSIILPAYKEADNLRKILPEIHNHVKTLNINYEIVVIDTIDKMDDTDDVCKKHYATYIKRVGGNLYGDAIRTGISKAAGKFILMMDADGSHEPKSIIDLYKKTNECKYDVVVGSRYCKGGCTDNSLILKAMSWSLNLTYRLIFRLKVKDCSNSFRIYNAKKLKSLNLESDNFDIVEEILIKLSILYSNLRIGEVPIHFKKRDEGVSKRELIRFILTYFVTIKKMIDFRSSC